MKRKRIAKQFLSVTLSLGMALTSFVIPQAPAVVYAEEVKTNLLGNCDFSEALANGDVKGNWEFWTDRGSSSTVTNGALNVTVAGGDEKEHWHTQLTQRVDLEDNTVYTLSFDAVSTANASIGVELQETNNWASALTDGIQTYNLAAGIPQKITISTKAAYTGFSNAKLSIQYSYPGNAGAVITISNIELTGGAGTTPTIPDTIGKEYDFSAVDDNAANNYADPGKEKDGYNLVWADEFDGNYGNANVDAQTGLNLDNWAPQLGDGTTDCNNPGWGNKELQAYTASAKNIGVNEDLSKDGNGDGLLRITAAYEPNGYVYGTESSKKYTSARLRTTKPDDALFNTTYGYVEARISLPETKGAWPAFWMLPESTTIYGNWPVSGEIDIMETVGAGVGGKQACGTLHWGAPEHVFKGSGYVDLSSNFSYFHTYAIDWEPGKITWYYDGEPINSLSNWKGKLPGASDALSFDAPFDEPFYMLLNLAIDSGQFGGATNKATFEQAINMYVDYVRVYHRKDGYAPSVIRSASEDTKTDWATYAGTNLIPDVTTESIDTTSGGALQDATADVSKWMLSNQDDGQGATINAYTDSKSNTWAKVGIANAGANDYSVQLIGHYNAKAGYVYKVSFDAFAEGGMIGKTVNCDSKEWNSWGTYGIQSFELKDEPTTTSFLFAQTEDFDKCRIEFNIGAQGTGTVYVGNVKVEIVDPLSLDQETDLRKPLADGNLIYNGSFDQGDLHTGYWRATEGTTFEVPRYTATALKDTDLSVEDVAAGETHYYERRAQISSENIPTIYQPELKMAADDYQVSFDLYSTEDTNVTVGIYRADENGLGTKLVSAAAPYSATAGVKTYTWNFTSTEDIENGALVFCFDKGAAVMLDNVSMIGASQAEKIDETPVTADDEWQANTAGAAGAAITLNKVNDTWVASGVTSAAGAWYTPQIGSNDFNIAGKKTYTLSFKVKMDQNTNGTFDYIIQEDGGNWKVVQDVVSVDITTLGEADADGFYTYTKQITAADPVAGAHVNFGLGNSGANNGTFSFKDVNLTLNKAEEGNGNGQNTTIHMPETYSISYELDGGVNAQSNPIGYTGKSGNSISLAAPTKDGYTFLGWTLGQKGSDYISSLSTDRTGAITLYANWKENKQAADTKPEKDTSVSGKDKDKSKDTVAAKPGKDEKTTDEATQKNEETAKIKVEKITLTGISKKIAAGKQIQLYADVAPANATDKAIVWKSDNTKYATVSDTGLVTTKKAGKGKTVTITATAKGGSEVLATYKIKIMKKAVTSIKLKASSKKVKAGKTVTIKATVNPSSAKTTNRSLTWKSGNSKYATVSKKGVVKTKKAGKGKTVKITATATDGSNKQKTIQIKIV